LLFIKFKRLPKVIYLYELYPDGFSALAVSILATNTLLNSLSISGFAAPGECNDLKSDCSNVGP